jgi:hypothetical protein
MVRTLHSASPMHPSSRLAVAFFLSSMVAAGTARADAGADVPEMESRTS